MKPLLILLLSATLLLAEFFVVHDGTKTAMVPMNSGKIDLSVLPTLPIIDPKAELYGLSDDPDVNHRHMNYRTATLSLLQSNTSLDNYPERSEKALKIIFGKPSFSDGMLLELFYHNAWYAVALGDPLKYLKSYFANPSLDPEAAYRATQELQKGYPNDKEVSALVATWHARYRDQLQSESLQQIHELEKFYLNKPNPFFKAQLEEAIREFEKEHPDSRHLPEIRKIQNDLK